MKIAIYPNLENQDNESILTVAKSIKKANPEVVLTSFPDLSKIDENNIDFDIAWLNWFENLSFSPKYFFKEITLKLKTIQLLKKKGVKLYVFFHNKLPHESRLPLVSKLFFKYLLNNSDKILIHCDKSKEYIKNLIGESAISKTVKISHPAYALKPIDYSRYNSKKFTVLFFGFLRPYKNIELIFKLAQKNPGINFIIAGKPITPKYGDKLKYLASKTNNIELILGFQNNEDIEQLIERSSIVLLPYNLKSSLNSGVLFYAFSKGINAIVPYIGSVDEFENKDLIYHYSYTNEKQHFKNLQIALQNAYQDFTHNREEFYRKNIILQEEVAKFSIEYLAQQIKESKLV